MRRLVAAAESAVLGYGGVSLVARATGVSRRAITEGLKELSQQKLSGRAAGFAVPDSAERCGTKTNGRQGSKSPRGSGPAGGTCHSRRSGIATSLDMQERTDTGRGTAARGSRSQSSDRGRVASRDGL